MRRCQRRWRRTRHASRVAVAARDGHARLGQPELGADDMHDAVFAAFRGKIADAKMLDVPLQGLDLRLVLTVGIGAHQAGRRVRVILGGEGAFWMAHGKAAIAKRLKGLRAGHLVDEVKADKELISAPRQWAHDVPVKDLFVQRLI